MKFLRAAATGRLRSIARYGSGVDPFKEIQTTLEIVDESKLLTKVAKTGLLSKLDKVPARRRYVPGIRRRML